jgi:acyl carrier protein
MSIEKTLRAFILDELHWNGRSDELSDDYPLIERGVMDSLGIFSMVSFVESEYGIEIQDEDLVPANFGTIGGIVRLVGSKREA